MKQIMLDLIKNLQKIEIKPLLKVNTNQIKNFSTRKEIWCVQKKISHVNVIHF